MNTAVFVHNQPFPLRSGQILPRLKIAYRTWGSLNQERSNVVWVCHALTGDSNVPAWWPEIWGKGKFLDPEKYFIVCANVIGSCYGSTYALSPRNGPGSPPWWYDFPVVTVADMVAAHDLLRKHLKIPTIKTGIGGSLGGQQVLEWATRQPGLFEHIVPIATNAWHSPWGIAFNESQRMAIEADATWGEQHRDAGITGMKAARATALLSYRAYEAYGDTQAESSLEIRDNFRASSYQRYQGEKLANRFDAFAYWYLSKAMDSHQIGKDGLNAAEALARVQARATVIGIESDLLFPPVEQQFIAEYIPKASLHILPSRFGHDGFLKEAGRISELLLQVLG